MLDSKGAFCRRKILETTGNLFNKTLYRWFVLNMPWPKGRAQAHPDFRIVELGIIPQDLEKEKQLLIENLRLSFLWPPNHNSY